MSDVELRDQEEVSQEEDRESVLRKVRSGIIRLCLTSFKMFVYTNIMKGFLSYTRLIELRRHRGDDV